MLFCVVVFDSNTSSPFSLPHSIRRKTRGKIAMVHIPAAKAECHGVGDKEDDSKKRGPPPILYSIYDLATAFMSCNGGGGGE
jgi:hypothetical protein